MEVLEYLLQCFELHAAPSDGTLPYPLPTVAVIIDHQLRRSFSAGNVVRHDLAAVCNGKGLDEVILVLRSKSLNSRKERCDR